MKKLLITYIFLIPFIIGAQKLHYGSGGKVLNMDNKIIAPSEVRELLKNNTKALKLYNTGREKKSVGNIMFYGGFGLVISGMYLAGHNNTAKFSKDSQGIPIIEPRKEDYTLAYIGSAFFIASIPIKIGYPHKIKSALSRYNKGLTDNYKTTQKLTLVASNQQFGFRYEW
jgi:hypothetical protein